MAATEPSLVVPPQMDTQAILEAIRQAGREAVIVHKKMGWPMVTCRDGKVVWIPPEELPDYSNE